MLAHDPSQGGVRGELSLVEPLVGCRVMRKHFARRGVGQQPLGAVFAEDGFRVNQSAGKLFLEAGSRWIVDSADCHGSFGESAVQGSQRVPFGEGRARARRDIIEGIPALGIETDLYT